MRCIWIDPENCERRVKGALKIWLAHKLCNGWMRGASINLNLCLCVLIKPLFALLVFLPTGSLFLIPCMGWRVLSGMTRFSVLGWGRWNAGQRTRKTFFYSRFIYSIEWFHPFLTLPGYFCLIVSQISRYLTSSNSCKILEFHLLLWGGGGEIKAWKT